MSQPKTIVEWLQGLPIGWLVSGPVGSKDVLSYGTLLDNNIENIRTAIKARMPDYAPSDALSHVGGDRLLIQGYAESDANFRIRCKTAFDDWERAGAWLELLVQLYWEGYTDAVIVQQNGLAYSLSGAPTAGEDPASLLVVTTLPGIAAAIVPTTTVNDDKTIPATTPWWMVDSQTGFCSRFAVILPTQPNTVVQGAPMWASGVPTADALSRLRRIVQTWRPANAQLFGGGIIAFVSGLLWGYPTTQTWGAGGLTWGGTSNHYEGQ